MVFLNGVEGRILVNSVALKEYDNDENEDTPNTITKYIEAVSGAKFEIGYGVLEDRTPKHDIVVWVSFDEMTIFPVPGLIGSLHFQKRAR